MNVSVFFWGGAAPSGKPAPLTFTCCSEWRLKQKTFSTQITLIAMMSRPMRLFQDSMFIYYIFLNTGCSSQPEMETFGLLWKLHETAAPQIFQDKFSRWSGLFMGWGNGAFMGVCISVRSAHKWRHARAQYFFNDWLFVFWLFWEQKTYSHLVRFGVESACILVARIMENLL